MIDGTDFLFPGTGVFRNKLGITDSTDLSRAVADSVARRLAELRTSPIRGGFDSTHLQAIHRHIFQDVCDWAGELRMIDANNTGPSQVKTSLNNLFDQLGRENHLKGLSVEDWARTAAVYIDGLGTIRPFWAGNEITIREFAVELARRNNISLQWDAAAELADDHSVVQVERQEQSANLRRMVMLAMDTYPCPRRQDRDRTIESGMERIVSFGNPTL